MQIITAGKLLFLDSLWVNLVFNLNPELIIYVVKHFNTLHKPFAILISTLAYTIAITINYYIGKLIFYILLKANKIHLIDQTKTDTLIKHYKLFVIFSVIPIFGKFIILAGGFSRFPVLITITLSTIFKLFHYIIIMYL